MRMPTLLHKASLEKCRTFVVYPLTQCKAEPLAADHVPTFELLLNKWSIVSAMQLAIDDKVAVAQALRDRANRRMHRCADRLTMELLVLTGGDRSSAFYVHYLDGMTLTDFKKCSFPVKLARVKAWVTKLPKSGQPTLLAIVPEAEATAADGDAVTQLKIDINLEKSHFRNFGERLQLVDEINVACKSIHGELCKLPHQMLGLPNDFADRIFRPERRNDGDDEEEAEEEEAGEVAEPTIDSVTIELDELQEKVTERTALLAALKAKKVELEKVAAAIESDKAKLAALQKSIAAQEKLAEELKGKPPSE